jgi:Skp family chaperone for outer membrane proteins
VSTKVIAALTSLPGLALAATLVAEPAPTDENAAEAKQIVKQFSTTLKGELQAAMKAGGPVKAIEVCQKKAPAIAHELSAETGWDVGRTSLKVRNTELDSPDAWEKKVMEQFEARKAAGEKVETMTYAEVVEEDGAKRYRFMKAIPTGKVCLACHGTAITPEVAAALDNAYPDDQATGFRLGDIRGAFTLSKPL